MNANSECPLVVLMKADSFGDIVKNFLGPIMKDLYSSSSD